MNPEGIWGRDRDIALFKTMGDEWRVMDFGDEYPETIYWGPSLNDAMRYFCRWTARKSMKTTRCKHQSN